MDDDIREMIAEEQGVDLSRTEDNDVTHDCEGCICHDCSVTTVLGCGSCKDHGYKYWKYDCFSYEQMNRKMED